MSLSARSYSYYSFFTPGLQYPLMESHLEALRSYVNSAQLIKLNITVVDVAQRSPFEIDALELQFPDQAPDESCGEVFGYGAWRSYVRKV